MHTPEEKQYRRRRMNRKTLEESLGRRIKVRLFDGAEYEGYLRKSGDERPEFVFTEELLLLDR